MKPVDLETRIADAFATEMTSQQLAELLVEVEQADEAAKAASQKASEIALDPATRPEAVTTARKDMQDTDFRRDRFERARVKLSELKAAAISREQRAAREREHSAAIAERDQLVKDLQEYDALARRIAGLLNRLQASNARVGDFASAEIIARGAGEDWAVRVDEALPKLLQTVRLPKFRRDGTNSGYLWPR